MFSFISHLFPFMAKSRFLEWPLPQRRPQPTSAAKNCDVHGLQCQKGLVYFIYLITNRLHCIPFLLRMMLCLEAL